MNVVVIVKMNHSAWLAMAQISLKEKLEFNLSCLELSSCLVIDLAQLDILMILNLH